MTDTGAILNVAGTLLKYESLLSSMEHFLPQAMALKLFTNVEVFPETYYSQQKKIQYKAFV